MVDFFFKYRVLFVKFFIFVIVSFIISKEIFLLNEELLLIIAFFLFLFATFDIFSALLKNELDARAENIIRKLDKLWNAFSVSSELLGEVIFDILWLKWHCFTVHSRIKKVRKKFEYYTLLNSNKELQKHIINIELRIIFLEQVSFLKYYYFYSVSRLENNFIEVNPYLEDFVESQIDVLDSIK